MDTSSAVRVVISWIDQAERQSVQLGGSYANGGRAVHLKWMKNTLLTAPSQEVQRDLISHWVGTGALPRDILTKLTNE